MALVAIYTHCFADRLKLVLADYHKSVAEVSLFFAVLEKLYVFTFGSVTHTVRLYVQRDLHPREPARQAAKVS